MKCNCFLCSSPAEDGLKGKWSRLRLSGFLWRANRGDEQKRKGGRLKKTTWMKVVNRAWEATLREVHPEVFLGHYNKHLSSLECVLIVGL